MNRSRIALRLATAVPMLAALCLLNACSEQQPPSESLEEAMQDSAIEHAQKHQDSKYVCPMHPQIARDEPGSCPICGMDLVLKKMQAPSTEYPTVEVGSAMQHNLGIRSAAVETDTLWKYIRAVGRVEYDETRLVHMHPRAEGWLETLNVRAENDPVEKGQLLGDFYSQEILAAQVDFLISLEKPGQKSLDKTRNRLRLLGVDEKTISRIEKRREAQNTIPIYAPMTGIITRLGAREGMFVQPEMEMFTIANFDEIWIEVDIFEHQLAWVKPGLSADITVPAYPGRTWEGRVEYLYPELDPVSRTLTVRLLFPNPGHLLRPNMFAEVSIYGGPSRDVLTIPREALIITGDRTSVVRMLDDNRFQPVDVVTGIRQKDRVEILEGLKAGDRIVTSGQFLIDSESSLQASFQRLAE